MIWPIKLLPFTIPVTFFLASSLIAPSINDDSAMGFLVLRSMMLEGSGFNHVLSPDPTDISHNTASFMTHWTPGQWLIPGLFIWWA